MFLLIFLTTFVIQSVVTITKVENNTLQILGKLTNFALQSRQNYQNYYPSYPIPIHSKPFYYPTYYPKPSYYYPPAEPSSNPTESVTKVLHSISNNDDLQCVPKIICEVTSDSVSGRQSGFNLPVNINMESLIGLLSAFNGLQSSPLLYFGKAALLGYTSKGNSRACENAYPECPADPDKLVQYLNNYNGGFFRYFNGVHPSKFNSHFLHHPNYFTRKAKAEQRIQNNPVAYLPLEDTTDQKITFPYEDDENGETVDYLSFPPNKNYFTLNKHQGNLKFPEETDDEVPNRKPKGLSYYYKDNEVLDIQRPLPNHKATPLIFPLRTGTGDLRLDADELDKNTAYEDDDVKIVFNGFQNKDFYFPSK